MLGQQHLIAQFTPSDWNHLSPLKPTIAFDTYWKFAAERQSIFFKKVMGETQPWTLDPILRVYKFTNAYRAADRVSQYLIKNVIYSGNQSPEEVFFRIILFKIFNKIETWEFLLDNLGEIEWNKYSYRNYCQVIERLQKSGDAIFSAAYIMPTPSKRKGERKYKAFLKLLEKMVKDNLPLRLIQLSRMQDGYELLKGYSGIGDFLAYQYITDINYSNITNFSEMEFVVPGPGARDGIHKCFIHLGGLTEVEVIRRMADIQEKEFKRLGIQFRTLWGRRLQLIDCQNLFCEISKYSRLAHPDLVGTNDRKRIKQRYKPKPDRINFFFPPKWGING
jgi:hypothetical protein